MSKNKKQLEGLMRARCEFASVDGVIDEKYADVLMAQINALNPLRELRADDVYIRSMRLAGDQIMSFYGHFLTEDMPAILAMCNGAPLMVGHDTDKLPIGTFFGGRLINVDGAMLIQPNFYWLRETSGAEDMRRNIDSGIYREGSLGWRNESMMCDICKIHDIRDGNNCSHWPGQSYGGVICTFTIKVAEVREGSIVYRGAHKGTGMGLPDELAAALADKAEFLKTNKSDPDEGPDNKSTGGNQDVEPKQIALLAIALGIAGAEKLAKIDAASISAEDVKEILFETLVTAAKEAAAFAATGKAKIAADRAEVVRLATSKAQLTGGLLADGRKAQLEKLEGAELKATLDELCADVDRLLPKLTCHSCGSHEISRRQSDPGQADPGDDPVMKRRADAINAEFARKAAAQ